MRNGVLWLSIVVAAASLLFVSAAVPARTAYAIPGDACKILTWDSTGKVLNDGDTVGGNGYVYLLFWVEDDAIGFVDDFLTQGPGADVIEETIDQLEDEIADLEDQIADLEDQLDDPGLTPDEEDAIEAEIVSLEAQIEAREEVIAELLEALDLFTDTDLIQIDSQTGSASITSLMEITGFEDVKPLASHLLTNPVNGLLLTQRVDHVFPDWFGGADGDDLDSISAWLKQVGVPVPAGFSDAANVCGSPNIVDGWGFVDIKCTEAGTWHVNVIPDRDNSSNQKATRSLACPGYVDSAKISSTHTVLETQPVGSSSSSALISVTTYDHLDKNVNGAEVTFITDTCTFSNPLAGSSGDKGHQPAGGGPVLTMWTDTDSQADANFLTDNPSQTQAGTAEVRLECAKGTPGTVHVQAQVNREGADIILPLEILLVGPTSSSGLTLTLNPDDLECGETLQATATAVDANGNPVSNGTRIYFTTDTSSAIINGKEGGQGSNTTIDGKTVATIAMSPDDPGIHTVIAYTLDNSGALLAQVSQTLECSGAVAPAAPTVAPPATGTGSITPPNTGDAGLLNDTGAVTWTAWAALAAFVGGVLALAMFMASDPIRGGLPRREVGPGRR